MKNAQYWARVFWENATGIKGALNKECTSGTLKNIFVYNTTVYGIDQQRIYINYPTIENISIMTLEQC